jgi:hypothetical protein
MIGWSCPAHSCLCRLDPRRVWARLPLPRQFRMHSYACPGRAEALEVPAASNHWCVPLTVDDQNSNGRYRTNLPDPSYRVPECCYRYPLAIEELTAVMIAHRAQRAHRVHGCAPPRSCFRPDMRAAAGKAERDPLWRVLRNTSERTIAGSQRSHGRPLGYQIAVKLQTDTGRESTLSPASGIRHPASGIRSRQRAAAAARDRPGTRARPAHPHSRRAVQSARRRLREQGEGCPGHPVPGPHHPDRRPPPIDHPRGRPDRRPPDLLMYPLFLP